MDNAVVGITDAAGAAGAAGAVGAAGVMVQGVLCECVTVQKHWRYCNLETSSDGKPRHTVPGYTKVLPKYPNN